MIHETAFIHPKAHVEGVTIGARTKVWQFSTIIRGTVLGEDCNVASNVTLDGPRFGDRCIICPGVDMGPGFLIGNDVFIGPNVVICNDAWPRTHKDGWSRADFEHAANGWYGLEPARWAVIVEDGASIGANAVILPGVIIGKGAMVGAGVTVSRDVPAGHLMTTKQVPIPIGDDSAKIRMRFAGERIRGVSAAMVAAE